MGTVKLKLTESTNDVVGASTLLVFKHTSAEVLFSTSSFFALK